MESVVEATDAQAITREHLQRSIERAPGADFKAYRHTLKEWVTNHLEVRVQSAGVRYFAEAYKPEKHRKRFSRYLETILSGRSTKSAEVANFYEAVRNPSSLEAERYYEKQRAWLRAFFKDEPEYERKLRAWIREIEKLYHTRQGTRGYE